MSGFVNPLSRQGRRNRREDMNMTAWIAMGLVALLFVGPLVWRTWRDHLEDRALSLQADLQAAVNHALGGESLVAVRGKAGAQDGTGTVEIYVPAGWGNVPEDVWPAALSHMPAGYTLVVMPRASSTPAPRRPAARPQPRS